MNGTANGNRMTTIGLTLLVPPVLVAAIGWVASCSNRIGNHTERIAVIESQLRDTRDELRLINQKLDRILEQIPRTKS